MKLLQSVGFRCSLSILLVLIALWGFKRPCVAAGADEQEPNPNPEAVSTAPRPEQQSAATPRYTYREDHDRFGTGKFYMGREIAPVVGAAEVRWLERVEREKQENLPLMIDSLQLKPGMVVSDIGAGSGVISLRMAERVAPNGKVLAVDVQQEMLDILGKKLKQQGVTNVELLKGGEKSPNLPEKSVDLAIMVDVYHELQFPYEMMKEISKSLRPGGRVIFVEYRLEDPEVPIKRVHKMSQEQVKKEASQPEFGLKWKQTIDVLPWQHMVVFERSKD